ncbi:MAG: transcription antitermination factor NusB [Rhodospirillaceae bacterium]|nr:transcription antitermination factor NusB [Rhodospirillaceae bacterium]
MTDAPSSTEVRDPQGRTAARLAAAQALYQIEASQNAPDAVIKDFLMGKVGSLAVVEDADTAQESIVALAELDSELFIGLIRCVQDREAEIDGMIRESVSKDWPWERLEMILRAILRAGVAELLTRTDIPPGVTVNEFIDVAHAFYPGPEPRMVNAVLDRIGKALGRFGS